MREASVAHPAHEQRRRRSFCSVPQARASSARYGSEGKKRGLPGAAAYGEADPPAGAAAYGEQALPQAQPHTVKQALPRTRRHSAQRNLPRVRTCPVCRRLGSGMDQDTWGIPLSFGFYRNRYSPGRGIVFILSQIDRGVNKRRQEFTDRLQTDPVFVQKRVVNLL